MDKPIEDIVFKEKKGFVTDPIRRPERLPDPQGGRALRSRPGAFEEVEERDSGRLTQPKMEPKVRDFLTQLREERSWKSRKATWIAAPRRARTRAGRMWPS